MSNDVTISIVVAAARNGVIGRDGDLPWRLSDDLKWFKQITLGKPMIMGRTTYESIGRPLPGRTTIVLTRRPLEAPRDVLIADSVTDALELAKKVAAESGGDEICIVGGANVYEQYLGVVDRIYLTKIDADIDGDRRFPFPANKDDWQIEQLATIEANDKNDFPASVERWDRRSSPH